MKDLHSSRGQDSCQLPFSWKQFCRMLQAIASLARIDPRQIVKAFTGRNTRGRHHGGRRPSSDDSFRSTTVIPPSALDKPSIMKRYYRRWTCNHTSPHRSPTMVRLYDTRFVEYRWWNDSWTAKTVVTWRSSASMIPAPDLTYGCCAACVQSASIDVRQHLSYYRYITWQNKQKQQQQQTITSLRTTKLQQQNNNEISTR